MSKQTGSARGTNVSRSTIFDLRAFDVERLQRLSWNTCHHKIPQLGPDLVLTYGWGGTDALLAALLGGLRRVVHAEDGFLPDETSQQRPHRLRRVSALLIASIATIGLRQVVLSLRDLVSPRATQRRLPSPAR